VSSRPSDQSHDAGTRDAGGDGSLGEQLRRARAARGISLREISDQTRITIRHLEAIESDDYKNLPGGIFNRSFIRAYARAVGYDEKRALDLYSRALVERGENLDEVATSPTRERVYMDGDVGRSPALTFVLSALLVGIVCLGIYALYYAYNRRFGTAQQTDAGGAAQPAASPQQAAAPPAPTPEPTPEPPAGELRVQIKARDRSVWVTARQDDGRQTRNCCMLSAGEARDFAPEKSLLLRVGRNDMANLEVTINGRPARMPEPAAGDAEWVITKDNFRQFLP
jgi:cytoskeleton protein RodZ